MAPGIISSQLTFALYKSQKEERFYEIMAKNFSNMKKETDTKVQKSKSPKQHVWKETHIKTFIIKMVKVKGKELKQEKESQTRELPQGYQLIVPQKFCKPEVSGMIYLKC